MIFPPAAEGLVLGEDQAEALTRIAVSGRVLDVLVGPAGAGKTTAMNALRRAWEAERGKGSVVGLAPSAVAAQVLADDLGIETENTAMWWQNHLTKGHTFAAGQLVVVDEATLAGTLSLDRITGLAQRAGAKVLLVGDYAQLQSVDAGGVFSMLAHDRTDTVDSSTFTASTSRGRNSPPSTCATGHTAVIDTYLAHGRIRDGDTETMTDAAYTAWRADRDAGRITVLIAETREQVTELNQRARAELLIDGTLTQDREVELRDGTQAGVGDTVITRHNDRKIAASNGNDWVRNGDIWTITDVRDDGSLTIRRPGGSYGGAIVLPAAYVAEHVDLGYAVTAHRAQGVTTDTAHILVEPTATRENFYVSMTRGRAANHAYVILDRADDHQQPHPGAEQSAHETITAEHEQWGSIAQLAAEYETIAAAAQHDRWASLVRASGLTAEQAQAAVESEVFGPLTAELRRAEANHHDIETLLPRLVGARAFGDADDIAAVIHYRVSRATLRPAGSGRARKAPRLIAGLLLHADGVRDREMRAALDERKALIEARADAVLDTALTDKAAWTKALGTPPRDPRRAATWRKAARVVAACRDRYRITNDTLLGAPLEAEAQKIDAARRRCVWTSRCPHPPR